MKTIIYIDKNNITHKKEYDDNVISIDLSYHNIIEIKNIDNLINLQKLCLYRNNITELENINHLVNLQILDLRNNNIIEIKNIDKLVNLQ